MNTQFDFFRSNSLSGERELKLKEENVPSIPTTATATTTSSTTATATEDKNFFSPRSSSILHPVQS